MKKIILLMSFFTCFTACIKLDITFPEIKDIDLGGWVSDADGNPILGCSGRIYERYYATNTLIDSFMMGSIDGSFTHSFVLPRSRKNPKYFYHIVFEKQGYYNSKRYEIDVQANNQRFDDVVLLPIEPNDSTNSDKNK